ncbi:DNA methylase [Gordonia sp. CNJ-863]|uniref:BREX-2 system adenine-specific DNA-methyltransferase PglX n=1 Tax=Gordonia TaxID=2053 RepID=UPI00096213EF|nr:MULTISPECIES: BREX-2 system adenine-specific DNA-methyltransferase PglX [Gordonia]MDH3022629.1 BREX-2 system adenine-specific DNA-methyltransferase PglX [Gordonia alkanivorans]MDH3026860.1 BREX-2 system adenine-specific DNA-methyltransferase PglX [Gordonia alkanivorans]MDJ0010276.1 BREX-2 system adenine-specific DNA-methyltransferase PglX [Gordonia alkanivorans]MDJ0100117.1 BREX-2 system adenine-specific DNA-methyltransferase PglX [Gordonia alkanivorans]MDJ0495909.1 BREX-2 system adenine-sp
MTVALVAAELVKALRTQLAGLEDDLRARVDGDDVAARQAGVGEAWRAEHAEALTAQRTAASWQAWRDERVTQSAVAWLLLTVFARYCEDNVLVSKAWIGGPEADSRQEALDARRAYFAANPEHTDRDWLNTIAEHFSTLDATRGLVDSYSPLHQVAPSGDAARELLEFWWDKDDEGEPRWSFTGVDTRFLGDVYQDLSEFAKQTYALLQTPDFVEEFILDQTLEPALDERSLEGFTVIDPTCGSGHFLLGAFHRLLDRWQREAPALGQRVLVQRALESVYGVDINPFAVAIARFRLIVEALQASGDKSIEKLIDIKLNLATGDSLLWGSRQEAMNDDLLSVGLSEFALSTEDTESLKAILRREHDAVVGNPPYISIKDAALRDLYRRHYTTCHGKYVLTVPFMELFFDLAKDGSSGRSGWVGQITANSFMKREFGTKLIKDFLGYKDLQKVVDTSGAYIPGHGTPTVILVARNRGIANALPTVRAVLGIRGEPGRPDDAAKGLVWSAITEHIDEPGFENNWISVTDLPRVALQEHPWSLSGGGAVELLAEIDDRTERLHKRTRRIGVFGMTNADDVMLARGTDFFRKSVEPELYRPLIVGDEIRDWNTHSETFSFFPYGDAPAYGKRGLTQASSKWLWPSRTTLGNRATFAKKTYFEEGRTWYSWHQLTRDKNASASTITFAEVATHNHFVLDRGGKVFKQTAPVIKLPEGASEDDHLRLLGVLNSSVGCFWLKQNCFNKGNGGIGGGIGDEDWEPRYQFNGTTLKDFPLPFSYPLARARTLDTLAQELSAQSPSALAERGIPTANALETARAESERLRALMIAHQEELDWECYRLYGLIDGDLTYAGNLPGFALGERAFEIALARAVEDGEHTAWFERHRSTPVTEIPAHLPADYRELLQRRLDVIASNPGIRLLEKPEHKRRWSSDPWDKRVTEALRDWLLDRVEHRELWFEDGHPTPRSVAQLADRLDRDEVFLQVLRLWAGSPDVATGAALEKLIADEGVPYLAAWRYKPSGLTKREAWEHTWDLQRREDAGEKLDAPIPVPPKYKPADFLKTSYWSRRGKLDVPKERFISYPEAGRDSDPTMLLGWAGWDHAEQALALAGVIDERITSDGWDQTSRDKLVPMLAGLAELMPWVRQWHSEIDPEFGESVADTIDEVLRSHSVELGVGPDELSAWRPPAPVRGRRTRKKTEDTSA